MAKVRTVTIVERRSRYVVEYRDDNGKRPRPSFATLKEAEKEKRRIEMAFEGYISVDDIAKVKAVVNEDDRAKPKEDLTIADAIKRYKEITAERHMKKTKVVEKLYFEYLWLWLEGEKGLEFLRDVRQVHLEELQTHLLNHGTKFVESYQSDEENNAVRNRTRRDKLAGSSVNRMFACYVSFFNKCVEWRLIDEDDSPIIGLSDVSEEPTDIKPWSKEQMRIASDALPPWAARFEFFLADTGRRPIDAERLDWTDVDLAERRFRVVTYKGGKPFISWFQMSDRLFMFFSVLHDEARRSGTAGDDEPVFLNSKGKRATSTALYQAFVEAREKCPELKGLTPYGMRHAFIDGLVDDGIHPRDIQLLAGHKKFETTIKYTHRKNDHLREVLTKASDKRKYHSEKGED